MCKSKAEGGLRCAGHMRPALVKAYDRYLADPSQENLDKLTKARDDYLETPEGWKKSIPAGEVEVKNPDGTTRTIPISELTGHSEELDNKDRDELAQHYQEKRESTVRAYKERRAEEEKEMLRNAADNPEEFYAKADAFWAEDEEDIEEVEHFAFAPEPVEGEEYDSDGYGVISGLNKRGFDRNGNHYETGDKYDEVGVDEHGFDREGVHVETEWIIDEKGYNRRGFNIFTGLHRNGRKYDDDGYDIRGYDKDGWSRSGWNEKKTRHRDTKHLPAPYNRFDPDGYDANLRDKYGFHKLTGTNERGFFRDGKHEANKDKRPPKCYADPRGFNINGTHIKTGRKVDRWGFDCDGYNKEFMDQDGHLNPKKAPNRSTKLIHTNPRFTNPLHERGYTERYGWTTSNARGTRKLLPVLVRTGKHYHKKPMRMLWEVGVVVVKHQKSKKQVKLYTATPQGSENRTVAFMTPQEIGPFLRSMGIEVIGKPFGDPF